MKFAATQYLWILWCLPALIFFFWRASHLRTRILSQMIARPFWKDLIPEWNPARRRLKMILILASVVFICLALLRPQWGYELREIKRRGIDIFVLADTSRSMDAQDVDPSRIQRAKRELIDLLTYLHGDRIGLIPFAGRPYVACPLTTDYDAFNLFLDQLDTSLIPVQGTDVAGALSLALKSFDSEANRSRALLLITDGEATQGDLPAIIDKAKEMNVRVFVMGIGSDKGAPIPDEEGGFKKDASGAMVLSKLDEVSLKKLALATDGTYVRSVTGDRDLEEIYLKGIKSSLEDQDIKSSQKRIAEERFQFPLAFAFLLLVLETLIPEVNARKKA